MQSDAVVNAGPAVFISPTGPNPLMVQAIFCTKIVFLALLVYLPIFNDS